MAFGSDDDATSASTPELRYGDRPTTSGSISPSSSSGLSSPGDETSVAAAAGGGPSARCHRGGPDSSGRVWTTSGGCGGAGAGGGGGGGDDASSPNAAAAAGRWLMMMPPIDERLEDVYTAFKRQCDGGAKKQRGMYAKRVENCGVCVTSFGAGSNKQTPLPGKRSRSTGN